MVRSDIEEPGLDAVGVAHGSGAGAEGTRCDGAEGDRIPTAVCIRAPLAARPTVPRPSSPDPAARLRPQAVQRMTEARSSASQWGQSFTPQGFDHPRTSLERSRSAVVVPGMMGAVGEEDAMARLLFGSAGVFGLEGDGREIDLGLGDR